MWHLSEGMNRVTSSWDKYLNMRVIVKHLKNKRIISSHSLPTKGYFCPTCGKDQPYQDWWCVFCGSPTVMGEPNAPENENEEFDEYFETDVEVVLKFLGQTKFGNWLYEYVK